MPRITCKFVVDYNVKYLRITNLLGEVNIINTVNIGIVDDVKQSTKIVEALIRNSKYSQNQKSNIYTYTSSKEIIGDLTRTKFDILFIDIDLENHISGIDVAYKIKEIYQDCLIIYISGYNNYYPKMVRNELFGFLEKPINVDEFNRLLKKAFERVDNIYKKFEFDNKGIHTMVRPYEIIYAYSQLRECHLVMDNSEILSFYKKLDDLEEELNKIYPHFVRVSKSFLVNYIHIRTVKKNAVIMDNGTELKISRIYKNSFVNKISKEI